MLRLPDFDGEHVKQYTVSEALIHFPEQKVKRFCFCICCKRLKLDFILHSNDLVKVHIHIYVYKNIKMMPGWTLTNN